MTLERNSAQAESKGTRQLVVRFGHAPCVKLTLQSAPAVSPAPDGVRVLRLRRPAAVAVAQAVA